MPLSQKQFSDFKKVCEQFNQVEEVIEEELVHEICDELIEELIEEGYSEEDAVLMIEDAANDYIDEAKVTFGHDTQAKRASGAPVGARRRFAMRKAGDAVKKAGDAVKGAADRAVGTAKAAKAGVEIAGTIAKDEIGRAGRKAAHSATKAADAVKSAPGKARDKAKKGIKGFIKRQAEKVVKRMSEENVENEGYQPMTPDRTARVDRAKKKAYDADHRAQYKGDSAEADKQFKRRMAMDSRTKMRKEELEASGLFTEEEINAILKADEQFDEAMSSYDRNRKRAAQRAAARNAARDAGKTGVVPGVGYVSPRRERETYTDEKGTVRHKSGAKMEEFEAVDEGLTGDRYKEALKKGKQYSRMVSADSEKRATRGGRGGESDFGAGDRGTGNRSRRRRGMSVDDED